MVRASELVSDRSGTVMCVSGAEGGVAMGVNIDGGKGVAMGKARSGLVSITDGGRSEDLRELRE